MGRLKFESTKPRFRGRLAAVRKDTRFKLPDEAIGGVYRPNTVGIVSLMSALQVVGPDDPAAAAAAEQQAWRRDGSCMGHIGSSALIRDASSASPVCS